MLIVIPPRKRDDRSMLAPWSLPHPARRLAAIHFGHRDIEDHDLWANQLGQDKRFSPGIRGVRGAVIDERQQAGEQIRGIVLVVYDENVRFLCFDSGD